MVIINKRGDIDQTEL